MTTTEQMPATPDAAVRKFILDLGDGPAMELSDLADKVGNVLASHPRTGTIEVRRRGKKGACKMIVRSATDAHIATVTVKASGEVDALPGPDRWVDPDAAPAPTGALTLVAALEAAGLPRAGHATIVRVLDQVGADRDAEITPDQAGRLKARLEGSAKAGLTGPAAVTWVVTGEDATGQTRREQLARQMTTTPGKTSRRENTTRRNGSPEDVRAAELATEAAAAKGNPLSQRVAPKEIAAARLALVEITQSVDHDIPRVLGFTSEKAMRAYVDGTKKDLADAAKIGVKALTKGIGSHQVWARKAAAAAFGIMLAAAEPAEAGK